MSKTGSELSRRALLSGMTMAASVGQASESKKLNVVLILADNLSYGDAGCYGGPIRTPNIDRLARQGVRFTHAYSTTMCSPSRAMLLTGLYAERAGLPSVIWHDELDKGLPLSEATLGDMFRASGYKTGCFGKWHLGHGPQYLPTNRGFDEFLGIPYSLDMPPCPLMDGTEIVEKEVNREALAGRITERAVQFIETHHREPFFLYFPHTAPHPPLSASAQFLGKSRAGIYGDVVEEMDWGIGRVLDTLKEHGLEENTLVIFTSDNGPYGSLGSAGGLRGVSFHTFEGAVREPFLARLPGRIPAGQTCQNVVALMDVVPTLARLCSLQLPERARDGKDIWPLLSRPDSSLEREPLLYFDYMYNVQCARLGKYKLHISRHDVVNLLGPPANPRSLTNLPLRPPELYDLEMDPGECYDIADRHPDAVRSIRSRVEQLIAGMPDVVRKAYADTQARETLPQEQGRRNIRPMPKQR